MATGVVFGSPASLILQPGAYSLVDASALNTSPPFAYNLVCVVGAALGGEPMKPYYFSDPIQAQQLFGANTPLAEAIRFAFKGGVNGGAIAVIGVRIDNCAQAYGTLAAKNGGAEVTARMKDFGAYGNTFSVLFYPGSITGTMAVIQGVRLDGRSYTQKIDNEPSFSRLIERITRETPLDLAIASGGVHASQTFRLATSQVDGRATLTDSQGVVRSNQVYGYQYPASMLDNTSDSLVVSLGAVTSWTINGVNAGTITTSGDHALVAGNFLRFVGEMGISGQYVAYAVPTASSLQVSEVVAPEEWAVSAIAGDAVTALGNTLANGDVVQLLGTQLPANARAERNYFVRDKADDGFKLATSATGEAIAFTGSINGVRVRKVAGAALTSLADIPTAVAGSRVSLMPGLTTITASNPAEINGSRIAAKVREAYTQAVSGVVVTDTAYSSDSARFTLQGAETWGHILGRGLPGSIFTIAAGVYQGTYQILYQEWDGLSSDKVRVIRKLSGDRSIKSGLLTDSLNFWSSFQFGRLQPSTEALETRLPANGLLATGGQYITAQVGNETIYVATQIGETIQGLGELVVSQINESDDMPVVASAAYNPATYTTTITLVAKQPGTVPNSYKTSILVNVQNTLLVSSGGTTLTGGSEPTPPRNEQGVTNGAILLSNGFDSVPTYQRWLESLERIKYIPFRWLIPAGTDNLGVQLAVAEHCTLMSSTPQRRERVCILGHGLGWSRSQIRERTEIFQNYRVIFVSSGFRTSDAITGNSKMYPSFYGAALVAGILAAEGNGISDPITHTYLKDITELEIEYQSGSDALDEMISSGVLTFESDASLTRQSRGYRITREVTAWRVTSDSAFNTSAFQSITVVNQSDFMAADIREMEEDLFIGKAFFNDTLEDIRVAVNLRLERRVRERIIAGYDPKFTQVSRNRDSSNACDVAYKIYPVPALEFVLNTQLLFPIPTAA
jgi:hypothetical protein